jgi:cell division protein FtsN
MQIDYTVVAIVAAVALLVIFLLVRKNVKDEKQFESDMNKQGTQPEKHDRDEDRV